MDKWYCIVAVIGLLLTNFSTNNGAVVDVGQFDNTEVSEEDALQLVRLLNGSGDVSPVGGAGSHKRRGMLVAFSHFHRFNVAFGAFDKQ